MALDLLDKIHIGVTLLQQINRSGDKVVKIISFLVVFILSAYTSDIFGQELYKWVDEKGTLHFTDNPSYAKTQQQKEQPKENGIEVLKKSEASNRQTTDPSGKRIIINYSQGAGGSSGSSGGGGSRSVSSGRS